MNELPAELAERLAADAQARAMFEGLPPSHRREYIRWISEAKHPQTRQQRAEKALAMIIIKSKAMNRKAMNPKQARQDIVALRGLGPASWAMLKQAGIHSAEDLRQHGAVSAYLAVQAAGAKPSLNLLWALEGALTDRDWKEIAQTERTRLLMALDDAQRSSRP